MPALQAKDRRSQRNHRGSRRVKAGGNRAGIETPLTLKTYTKLEDFIQALPAEIVEGVTTEVVRRADRAADDRVTV